MVSSSWTTVLLPVSINRGATKGCQKMQRYEKVLKTSGCFWLSVRDHRPRNACFVLEERRAERDELYSGFHVNKMAASARDAWDVLLSRGSHCLLKARHGDYFHTQDASGKLFSAKYKVKTLVDHHIDHINQDFNILDCIFKVPWDDISCELNRIKSGVEML